MTIAIIARNEQEAQTLNEMLSAEPEFEVVSLSSNTALEELEWTSPDIVLTDLILQGLDGMEVIEFINERLIHTKSIIITDISNTDILTSAMSKGASYCLIKPVSQQSIIMRIKEIATSKRTNSRIDEMITEIFLAIGIPPHIKGYGFLREAIRKVVENPYIMNSVTKGIYPHVAKQYNTTPSKVERAIRHAIEVGWNRGRHDAIASVFGTRAYINEDKPTNSEFIALVAEYILLHLF